VARVEVAGEGLEGGGAGEGERRRCRHGSPDELSPRCRRLASERMGRGEERRWMICGLRMTRLF
jgi:hypothetical protein